MGTREDALKREIEGAYGSIPQFCEATGIAKSTVYNVFSRGVENTRTRTLDCIYSYLRPDGEPAEPEYVLSDDERAMVDMYRLMSAKKREAFIAVMNAMLEG